MKDRSNSLDSLRGLAILLMVLSGSVAFGVLPGWMYHAQVPPPAHVFDPALPGMTWVDLVFPFFLFSMGAAIPLALHNKWRNTQNKFALLWSIFQRYLLLVFFALFTYYARAGVMSVSPSWKEYALSIGCFIILFLIYTRWESIWSSKRSMVLKGMGWVLALSFLGLYPFANGGFDLYKSDIILIVLANMAFFGSLIWMCTGSKPAWRIAVLPFLMAVFLASDAVGSWNKWIYDWSPLPWMYKFYYLKYLFILLPATLAGEWLMERLQSGDENRKMDCTKALYACICIWVILLCNLVCLYQRWLIPNVLLTTLICIFLSYLSRGTFGGTYSKMRNAGVYMLLLGLFFEAYEGGIKKDVSTYSYYFVCAGLAFLLLLSFLLLEEQGYLRGIFSFLAQSGRNPMIAYTAGNLLVIPLLGITNTATYLNSLETSVWGGLLRGILFTSSVAWITVLATKKKIFWKT